MTTMRAVVLKGYGGPEQMVLDDVEIPAPGPGQVRVRVHVAGLNPADYKMRRGSMRKLNSAPLPRVAGNELAGEIDVLGAGVKQWQFGDRVMARPTGASTGAFAEYAVVDELDLVAIPDEVDDAQAACLPLAGLAAYEAVHDELGVKAGDRVLIVGAAGGVGTIAVQLAHLAGAKTTATVSPHSATMVSNLGADELIDYTTQRIDREVATYDKALDAVGGDILDQELTALRRGGKLVSIAGVPEMRTMSTDLGLGTRMVLMARFLSRKVRAQARKRGVDYRFLFMRPCPPALIDLTALVAKKEIQPVIDREYRFPDILEALSYLENGHPQGKVVVRIK